MNRQLFGDLDLGTLEPLVAGAAVVLSLLWFAAAAFLYTLRAPPRPPVGAMTLDFGPESPALANFLVNGFQVTAEASTATLLDLAARRMVEIEQRGPGVFFVRLGSPTAEHLERYESHVLRHLERRAHDGVVPVDALTTGGFAESKGWLRAFREEVVADAQGRGLARDAVGSRAFAVLAALSAIPGACAWAAWGLGPAIGVVTAAAVCLAWIRRKHPQRATPAGLEAATRWLGVRAELASNAELSRHSPLTVALWDRLLAYGAALGVASAAARSLPLGIESDNRAWSSHGGRWREVRIRYPRAWPPAWGLEPSTAFVGGLATVIASAVSLKALGRSLAEAGFVSSLVVVALGAALLVGVAALVRGAADWKTTVEVTGRVIRRRAFDQRRGKSYFLALDDGKASDIRALRVSREQYEGVGQGELVTVCATPRLGRVRWIVPETAAD